MENRLHQLAQLGQSMWYDNISRELLDSGEIQALVDQGILGMTSNPTIFKKAITSGSAYDDDILAMTRAGKTGLEIYEALAVEDIQRAADILRPVYERTNKLDGYISLEVSPLLANDTQGTIEEMHRLVKAVDRPNLMVKIPATEAGIDAVAEGIAAGYNINVTLIFGLEMYAKVMDAYLRGLERRAAAGQPLEGIASVASFFVSRVDTLVDMLLDEKIKAGQQELTALRGQAGLANAKMAYALFKEVFTSDRFMALKEKGAAVQRPLWASTSTKDPAYPDTLYVDNLIGPDTVNTAPPETVQAFIARGTAALTIEQGLEEGRQTIQALEEKAGIKFSDVTDTLLKEGVDKFSQPFEQLLASIQEKKALLAEQSAG